jgi:hypothetical protein
MGSVRKETLLNQIYHQCIGWFVCLYKSKRASLVGREQEKEVARDVEIVWVSKQERESEHVIYIRADVCVEVGKE